MRVFFFLAALFTGSAVADDVYRCDGAITNKPKPGMRCTHYRTGEPYDPQRDPSALEWRCGDAFMDKPIRGCVHIKTGEVWTQKIAEPELPAGPQRDEIALFDLTVEKLNAMEGPERMEMLRLMIKGFSDDGDAPLSRQRSNKLMADTAVCYRIETAGGDVDQQNASDIVASCLQQLQR